MSVDPSLYVSGSASTLLHQGMYLWLEWETLSADETVNQSTVRISVYLRRRNVQWGIQADSTSFTMNIDGISERFELDPTFTLGDDNQGETEVLVKQFTYTIQHDDDGKKNVRMCLALKNPAYYHIEYGGDPDAEEDYISVTTVVSLTAIPQASAIDSITRDVYIGAPDSGSLNNKLSVDIAPLEESYRHDLIVTLGDFTETIYDVYDLAEFVVPVSWLAAMPTLTLLRGMVTLITYNDDGDEVGRVSTYWRARVDESYAAPYPGTKSRAHIGCTWNYTAYYLQGVSKVKITINNARSDYCADIVKYEIYCDEYEYVGESNNYTTGTINVSGAITYSAYVTDSRGFRVQVGTPISFNIYPYSPPRFGDVTTERAASDGTILNEGTYMKSTVNYTIDNPSFLSNTATTKIYYKRSVDSDYTLLAVNGVPEGYSNGVAHVSSKAFNIDTAYDIRYEVTDKFSTSYYHDVLPISHISLEFLAGGKGISFGKEATLENAADFGYKIYARQGIMPIELSISGNLDNGIDIRKYSLFAISTSIGSNWLLGFRELNSNTIYASRSRAGYDSEWNAGYVETYSASLTISNDGDKFTGALIEKGSIKPVYSGSTYSYDEGTLSDVTAIYALM